MNNEGLPGMFSHNILHWLETLLFLSPSLGRNIHEMIQLSLEGNEYRPKLCTRLVSFLSCLTRSGTLAVQLAIGFPPSSLFIQEALTCVISMSVKPYGDQTHKESRPPFYPSSFPIRSLARTIFFMHNLSWYKDKREKRVRQLCGDPRRERKW